MAEVTWRRSAEMGQRIARIFHLGVKELRSLRADPVLLFLVLYTFTIAVYTVANGMKFDVENAAVAVVDEDRSTLSRRLRDALLPPYFKPADLIDARDIDPAFDAGRYVFVISIPPRFERDLLSGWQPSVQIDVDATAMALAGNGAAYLQSIILQEVSADVPLRLRDADAVSMVVRARFNPNLESAWFTPVMQVINNITMLSVILAGAALIREREHGTIEHLLVMPVTPLEIMLAKIWANGLVIVVAAILSLLLVVERLLAVPIAGSLWLFVGGAVLYQFSVTALGILIATVSGSMAQFGLLAMPVLIVLNLLSGATTPMESMPEWLQWLMQATPAPHFVAFSQAVLYRGAGVAIVWPELVALAVIGALYLGAAAIRFRAAVLSYR